MSMEKSWRVKLPAFLPAAAWYWVIWIFSDQTAVISGGLSDRLIYWIMTSATSVFAEANSATKATVVELLSFFTRKTAHMFLYFVLALLVCFALCFFTQQTRWRLVFPAVICALLAGLDEYHQTLVPGRSGEVRDVIVDLCGAGIALGFLALPHLARWGRRSFSVPLPALVPAVVCLLPVILAVSGPGAMASSSLLAWAADRFLIELAVVPPLADLAPAAWAAAYLAACGFAGVCALLAALLAGAKPWISGAVGGGVVLIAALLALIGGAASPLAAACLALLGELGALAMWALGLILVPCEQVRRNSQARRPRPLVKR